MDTVSERTVCKTLQESEVTKSNLFLWILNRMKTNSKSDKRL